MEGYEPIACGLHDVVEDRIVRRGECEVVYDEGGERRRYIGRLADVYSRDGAEYVELADGRAVRLDRIAVLDGVEFTPRPPSGTD